MAFGTDSIALLSVLCLVVGAVGTLVGAGGGFLLAPVLLVMYPHDSPQTLTSISLAAVFANSTSGTIAYLRQRRVDTRNGLIFGAAAMPGAIGGALTVDYVPRNVFDGIMAAVLGSVAISLFVTGRRERKPRPGPVPVGRGVALSAGVGFLSSFLGIGGGVFHVPLLVMALGYPTHVATATSHFVLAQMSAGAVVTHAIQGSYHVGHGLRRSIVLAVTLALGAQVGAHLSTRTPARAIEQLLAVALLLVAIRLAFSA